MDCPVCRTYNNSGMKYCINCGRNLEDLPEFSYGQVDKGFYHTEEEYLSENSGFEISENTFTINDKPAQYVSENLFTSEELNSNDDFYFSGVTENNTPVEEFDFGGATENNTPVEELDFSETTEEITITNELTQESEEGVLKSQPYAEYVNNSVPLQAEPYNDIYGTSPQIIGYDANGMPVYSQPVPYPTSQVIGYDMNGQPVYSQPQIIGYDANGMPIYSQPVSYPQSQNMNFAHPSVYQQEKQPYVDEEAEKFRNFLDDGKNEIPVQNEEKDFFGKTSEMGDVALPDLDIGGLKKREKKKKVYMTDVEIQDAENLLPNDMGKFNQKYMRQASSSGSADLGEKKTHSRHVTMGETKNVDSQQLNPKFQYKSRIRMGDTNKSQTDDFNTRTLKKRKVSMAEADHAVEAMPKKKQYVDEIDLIELPEYMQARKKNKKKNPGMSEL
ncbi:MAG: hypothetical protein K2K89_01395 [Ruminococcus sp.]|nr:hypothetical protein [Ruminococcus sp.]